MTNTVWKQSQMKYNRVFADNSIYQAKDMARYRGYEWAAATRATQEKTLYRSIARQTNAESRLLCSSTLLLSSSKSSSENSTRGAMQGKARTQPERFLVCFLYTKETPTYIANITLEQIYAYVENFDAVSQLRIGAIYQMSQITISPPPSTWIIPLPSNFLSYNISPRSHVICKPHRRVSCEYEARMRKNPGARYS